MNPKWKIKTLLEYAYKEAKMTAGSNDAKGLGPVETLVLQN